MTSEEFEPQKQIKSAPGQMDLFPETPGPVPEPKYLRGCNRCHKVYDPAESPAICPHCRGCNEFHLVPVEQGTESMSTAAPTREPKAKSPKVRKATTSSEEVKPTAKEKAPKINKAASEAAEAMVGELVIVELVNIQPNPDNPRKDFDPVALQELADSIVQLGLLQPLLVGRAGGVYELIAGERRYRACKLAGLRSAPCYVREMDPADVSAARLAENLKRADLNAIEEAIGYERHLQQFPDDTQDDLANRVHVTQGQISNRLRLLKLPDAIKAKIISREMTPSQGRDLVPWVDLPAVFPALEKELKSKGKAVDMSPDQWRGVLAEALDEISHRLKGYEYETALGGLHWDLSKVSPDVKKRLDIRTYVDRWDNKVSQAFNVTLAKELMEQKLEAERKKAKRRSGKVETKTEDGEPTPERLKELKEQHAKRIYRYRVAWLQSQIIQRADSLSPDDLTCFVISLAFFGSGGNRLRHDSLQESAAAAKVERFSDSGSHDTQLQWAIGLDRAKVPTMLREYVKRWCGLQSRSWSSDANPVLIEDIASILGIDLKPWRADETFLKLHTTDQLRELLTEWNLTCEADKKSEIIAHIVAHAKSCKAPKSLLKVKAVQLD